MPTQAQPETDQTTTPARTRWTGRKIFKRIVIGVAFLFAFVAGSAWLIAATTDPLADRREAKLAAVETWQIAAPATISATQSPRAASLIASDPRAGLIIVAASVRSATELALAQGQLRTVRRKLEGAPQNVLMAWVRAAELGFTGNDHQAVIRARGIVARLVVAGADGIIVDFSDAAAGTDAEVQANRARDLMEAFRRIEPTLLVAAHAPSPIGRATARYFDGLIRVDRNIASRPAGQTQPAIKQGAQNRRVVFRDWRAGRQLLVLKTDGADAGKLATTLDFLPRTRLP